MSLSRVFPGTEHFLVLTHNGQIGRFIPGDGFEIFDRLSRSVADQSNRLLEAYRKNPNTPDIRPAIVLPPLPSRKWSSATLVFDRLVLQRIFPSGGVDTEKLTPFQARNRERSIFQGMELLINYENKSLPGVAFYCPVLYAQGFELGNYPDFAIAVGTDVPANTPVIEVLNLIALLKPGERRADWAHDLVHLVKDISIETSRRAAAPFKIQD